MKKIYMSGWTPRDIFVFLLIINLLQALQVKEAAAWSEHPLLVKPALANHPVWRYATAVEAVTLKDFLIRTESELANFLGRQEAWSVTNLPNYKPCPEALMFRATGNPDDILERFYSAIRINPHVKVPLYLHLIPGQESFNRDPADPAAITTLANPGAMLSSRYVWVRAGEMLDPFEVLCTANDEPDYGFDLGLFEDNGTAYGKRYGFGIQPFGNPNLEYSSQAPFHMGFFHEAGILYKFGPFLRETYIDYRIFLYKALSEFAFQQGQPYWGWRFMGWGMHYMGDVSMPYHMKPLPGVSTTRMMWINLKSILGASRARDNAVQIVSNRHTVFEEFQLQVLRKAYQDSENSHPFLLALRDSAGNGAFSYDFLINTAALQSASAAREIDRILKKNVPVRMVSDPKIEVSDLPELEKLMELIPGEMGSEANSRVIRAIARQMRSFSMNIRSFMDSILKNIDPESYSG